MKSYSDVAVNDGSRPGHGSTLYVIAVCIVAAIGGLLFGFDIGVIAGAIPFIKEEFQLNAHQEGFAVSNILLGGIIGSFAGPLSDRYGRKRILIIAAVLFTISAVFSALPRTYMELLIARFAGGIAVGASMLSALYISEIAPARRRGFLVSLNQFAIVTGILASYFTNWMLVDVGANNWRWMFAVEAIPASVFLIALFFVPESPRWLVKNGDFEGALHVFERVGGAAHAREQFQEIQQTIEKEKESFLELIRPGMRMALLIGVLISMFAQVTGIGAIIYYAPTIFMKAGYKSASSALFGSVLVGLTNFVGTIISFFIIDRFGRKPLLYAGLVGMCIALVLTGYSLNSTGASWILFPILFFILFYAFSLGPVGWVIVAEIFPTKTRGLGMAICLMVLWISDFSVGQTFPWLIETIKENVFYVFAVVCVFAIIFVFTIVPETKGKTLEQIEKMWTKH